MKHIGMIVIAMAALSGTAFSQAGPRDLAGLEDTATAAQPKQAPLQQSIVALYLSDLKNEVGLSDDQFLKVDPIVRQAIQQRFSLATQRRMLDELKDQLLSQPNPSPADLKRLNEQLTRLDNLTGTWKSRFMRNLQPQLTEYQQVRARDFNDKFIDEKLPTLLDTLRANAATKGMQTRPAGARANPNRKQQPAPQTGPANTLRGDGEPVVPPRQKLTR